MERLAKKRREKESTGEEKGSGKKERRRKYGIMEKERKGDKNRKLQEGRVR